MSVLRTNGPLVIQDGEDFPVEVKQAHHDVATEIYMQMVHLLLNLW